jgi:hypothetical protein
MIPATARAIDLLMRAADFTDVFGYAGNVAPRKWILDDAHCGLRSNFCTLSLRDLDVGKIRRYFVMQCKSFPRVALKKN